ncbi:MAG: hypothetical protein IKS90_05335 [Clostridia bacterium]|nr:hypothetical protein [Clostridia bacterium]
MKPGVLLIVISMIAIVLCGCRVEMMVYDTNKRETPIINGGIASAPVPHTSGTDQQGIATEKPQSISHDDMFASELPPVEYYFSETEFRAIANSKSADPIITVWDGYYAAKNAPDGYDYKTVKVMKNNIGVLYTKEVWSAFNKRSEVEMEDAETIEYYYLVWDKNLSPEYIESSLTRLYKGFEKYNNLYIVRRSVSCLVEWEQYGVCFMAVMPLGVTNKQIQEFCDAVFVKTVRE